MSLVLHGYWRSSASYRVRIALNLKGLAYDQLTYDLRKGEQAEPRYRAIAPQGLVPAIEAYGQRLTQSLAIMEWLDEVHPAAPLLPAGAMQRALVRSMASIVACDVHPLNNMRVLKALRSGLAASEVAVNGWIAGWIEDGFTALETIVRDHGDGFCFGDVPTLADCCLVPQIYNARRFGVDLSAFPALAAVDARCMELAAFADAVPERQPDADGARP